MDVYTIGLAIVFLMALMIVLMVVPMVVWMVVSVMVLMMVSVMVLGMLTMTVLMMAFYVCDSCVDGFVGACLDDGVDCFVDRVWDFVDCPLLSC